MSGAKIVKMVECLTHELWEDFKFTYWKFLNEITLAELVNKRNVKRQLIVILVIY